MADAMQTQEISMATEYLVILTVETTRPGGGLAQATVNRLVQVRPGHTRVALLEFMRSQLPEEIQNGVVTYFSADPNELVRGGERS